MRASDVPAADLPGAEFNGIFFSFSAPQDPHFFPLHSLPLQLEFQYMIRTSPTPPQPAQ